MVKFHVLLRRCLRQVFISSEAFVLRCIKHHRRKIVYSLHPISAIVLLLVVGLYTWYELHFILPELCQRNDKFYKVNCVLAIYMLHNILGNLICCWHTDTSFLAVAKARQQPLASEAHLWHLCTHCQMLVPPRAWHCRLCNTCMLKRDHHCNITANCIGHANQRYFIALLAHLTLGNLFVFAYNFAYVFKIRLPVFSDPLIFLGVDPVKLLDSFKEDPNWLIINGAVLKISVFSLAFVASQLGFQLYMISRGSCMYYFQDRSYDLGFWSNWRLVLGKRMFWTWLSPLISSPQASDGTQWMVTAHKEPKESKKPA
ncbi:probable palmitoyltransferase ZDHHC24 [Drosophila albomicans]|uniref:Palmitoyltransferase n=1 Tax=Drosophila albomicans TaxID=7291 RepID=A0A6P8XMA0_DROAB|nr:probable palmitoyltransferase ZDHHC24 [Drosophila albomicans]